MSEFNANKLNPDKINEGKKFNKGDGFSANDLNSVVEGILYSETQGGGSGLNLEKGEGEYSTVTKEEAGKENTAKGRADFSGGHKTKTYQKDSFGFGAGVISGMSENETFYVYRPSTSTGENLPMPVRSFNEFYWDYTTNTPKNDGQGYLDSNGNPVILDRDGRTYENSYGLCFTIGNSTANIGKSSAVSGENNLNEAPFSNLSGRYNWNKENGLNSNLHGYYNTNNGKFNTLIGQYCSSYNEIEGYAGDFNYCTLLGYNLKPSNDNCTIVGEVGGNKQRPNPHKLLFGVATKLGHQALEVYDDDVVRVIKPPVYDTDVVRFKEINDLDKKINNKIDTLHANGFIVAQTLPTASKDTVGKIYLVPHEEGGENDIYDEYITVSFGDTFVWEKIGSTEFKQIVDAELSSTSENPVQNKVINEALLKNLLNVTIIDQDLSKADFVPTPNTYYRHTNIYNTLYNYGTILFYNGTDYENVEILNNLVSEWSGLASVIGGYSTILARNTQGKYTAVGVGNVSVTKVGFVATYGQRTDANGVKSTVLATGNPVNDVDATPKKYVDSRVSSRTGVSANTLYNHIFFGQLSNGSSFEFNVYSSLSEMPIVNNYLQLTLGQEYTAQGITKDIFNVHNIAYNYGGNGAINPTIEYEVVGNVEGSDPIQTIYRITKIGNFDFSMVSEISLVSTGEV